MAERAFEERASRLSHSWTYLHEKQKNIVGIERAADHAEPYEPHHRGNEDEGREVKITAVQTAVERKMRPVSEEGSSESDRSEEHYHISSLLFFLHRAAHTGWMKSDRERNSCAHLYRDLTINSINTIKRIITGTSGL
ncbi:uncharacterized [Tachysurus ichikawai]